MIALVAAFAAGIVVMLVGAARADRSEVFSTGVRPALALTTIERDGWACQMPLSTPAELSRVQVRLGPGGEVRGPVRVVAFATRYGDPTIGDELASATLPRSPLTGEPVTLTFDRPVAAEQFVAVCVTQTGAEPVEVWGDRDIAHIPQTSQAYLNGTDLEGDLFLRFPRAEPASVLSLVPDAFRHAATFKLGGIGAWTLWLLAALLLIGAPVLLARGLIGAAAATGRDGDDR